MIIVKMIACRKAQQVYYTHRAFLLGNFYYQLGLVYINQIVPAVMNQVARIEIINAPR
jgi:hypothetical protein